MTLEVAVATRFLLVRRGRVGAARLGRVNSRTSYFLLQPQSFVPERDAEFSRCAGGFRSLLSQWVSRATESALGSVGSGGGLISTPAPGMPPGPRAPGLVQTLEWMYRPTSFMESCRRRYGDIFSLRLG